MGSHTRGGAWRWLLEWLDRGLSAQQRQLPPEQLGRYRVVLGASVLLGLLSLAYLACIPFFPPEQRLSQVVAVMVVLVALVGVGGLVRRGRSFLPPAALLCGALTAATLLATLSVETPGAVSHAANMLVPILAVYLLGARRGFVFTALFAGHTMFFHELYHSGFGRQRPPFSEPLQTWGNIMAGLALLLAWALSWLYTSSRDQSQQALERALQTLREKEGKLTSLIESTDDVVVALDAELRLVTSNRIAQDVFHRVTGLHLVTGQLVDALCPPELGALMRERCGQALAGERVRLEVVVPVGGQPRTMDVTFNPTWEGTRTVGVTVFSRDITERKLAETRMEALHRTLLDASRQAGMAEIATGVLHNVGNTLNSVNVSANLVVERLRSSRGPALERVVELLREPAARAEGFLAEDPRGRQVPAYLEALAQQLAQERSELLEEMGRLEECVSNMRSAVSMQQRHARVSGVLVWVALPALVDESMRPHAAAFEGQGIQVRREYDTTLPRVLVDRHKLAQIVNNLLTNARQALLARGEGDKHLTLGVRQAGTRVRITVTDDGVGIAPELLSRLFTQGFAPRKDGHGFGLHSNALVAEELGGSLTCASEGVGRGATFTLELPLQLKALEPRRAS